MLVELMILWQLLVVWNLGFFDFKQYCNFGTAFLQICFKFFAFLFFCLSSLDFISFDLIFCSIIFSHDFFPSLDHYVNFHN